MTFGQGLFVGIIFALTVTNLLIMHDTRAQIKRLQKMRDDHAN